MPLFKKKQPQPAHKEILADFERRMSETDTLPDPGARYLELHKIETDIIKVFSKNMYSDPEDASKNIKGSALLAGGGAALGTAVFFLIPPLGIAIASIGGGLGSLCVGANSIILLQSRKDKRELGQSYVSALRELYRKNTSKKEALVQNHLLDLRSSPRFKEICTSFPDVASAFAQAAAETGIDVPRIVRLDKTDTPFKP